MCHKKNLLILHGGGPTAVMNASLYGAIKEALRHGEIDKIYAAIGGTGGLLQENIRDLRGVPEEKLSLLLSTPGSAIGTSRDHLEPEDYAKMVEILEKLGVGWVLCNGGNGTMDACGNLYRECRRAGADIKIMGIPKTMDNDLAVTDHSPGYGSAARYIAQSVREVCADVKGLPIHVVVIEASGRNAGWITAASALAKAEDCDGPDLIYLPERPFVEAEFLEDVKTLIEMKKGVVVVASEGLRDADGKPVVPPIFTVGRATYFGDVSAHLANLVIKKLGYKARGEKPGLLGRASITLQSPVDRDEAALMGEFACRCVLDGESGRMAALRRVSTEPYLCEPFLVDINRVMLEEKQMPDSYINERGNGVTEEFTRWCAPLIGAKLPPMISFN